ncbi:replicase [Leviviridae sp.]|uniref:RNA-directed RNA polymerase n=1 Tax=ssRNA phage AVE006 TaxID=2848092 RepID=A0A142D867_9VIRU|nr:replicase [Leviviridae sp.]AMQ23536.1 replicase [ssRNA phage AVE006]
MATSKGKSGVKRPSVVKTTKETKGTKVSKVSRKSKVTKGNTKPKTQKVASKPKTTKSKTTATKNSNSKMKIVLDYSYAVISPLQARDLCRRDAKKMATDEMAYITNNSSQYYLLVNTWLLLVGELCNNEAQSEILFSIKRDGVIETIRHASEMLDNVRSRMRGDDVQTYIPFPSIAFCEDIRVISEVLAFPKRFSPLKADLRNAAAIKNFYKVNRRCRDYGRSNGSKWIEDRLREKFAVMLKDFTKVYRKYSECVYFSSGVCADAKVLKEKVAAYVAGNPDHEIYGFRFPSEDYKWGTDNAILRMRTNFYGVKHDWSMPVFTCKPTCVPKSYKTPRIICPEPTYAASKKQGILRAIRECLTKIPKGMQIFNDSDQESNQMLAFLGSRDGDYATIDKSSASDSISAALMARVLPDDVWEAIWPYYVSWFMLDDGRLVHKDMFASSGDPICFILEGCLFSALEMVAEDLVDVLCGKPIKRGKCYTGRVFGDDIITKTDYFQTYCDLAERLGFIINMDKSYGMGPFRESCGADFTTE